MGNTIRKKVIFAFSGTCKELGLLLDVIDGMDEEKQRELKVVKSA